jgi:hypothetical protein
MAMAAIIASEALAAGFRPARRSDAATRPKARAAGPVNAHYSPTALTVAFALGDVALLGGTSYTLWIVWKANRAATGATIYAGAGPVNGHFSPTWLTATLLN